MLNQQQIEWVAQKCKAKLAYPGDHDYYLSNEAVALLTVKFAHLSDREDGYTLTLAGCFECIQVFRLAITHGTEGRCFVSAEVEGFECGAMHIKDTLPEALEAAVIYLCESEDLLGGVGIVWEETTVYGTYP